MRKPLSIIMAIVCFMFLLLPGYAENQPGPIASGTIEHADGNGIPVGSFVKSEYDMYMELQNAPVEALLDSGYSQNTINEIKSTSIEEALYERAQLPEDELRNMGYSQEKIKLLKEYDGSPLSENPQMREVFPNLTGSFYVAYSEKTFMEVSFMWYWDGKPFLSGSVFTDIVACGFAGTSDFNNLPCRVTLDTNNSFCLISYYSDSGTFRGNVVGEISVQNPHQHIEVKFPMSKVFNKVDAGWAQKGTLRVRIKEENSVGKLYSCTFAFGCGHTGVGVVVAPSISVSTGSGFNGGVGLSFGLNTKNMFYKTMVLRSNGTHEIFEGN